MSNRVHLSHFLSSTLPKPSTSKDARLISGSVRLHTVRTNGPKSVDVRPHDQSAARLEEIEREEESGKKKTKG